MKAHSKELPLWELTAHNMRWANEVLWPDVENPFG